MSQSEFLSILDMRLDELDDKHRADLIGRALNIMLNYTRWRDRVENLKKAWSEVHTSQQVYRRELRNR